jgi:hypothetical protein
MTARRFTKRGQVQLNETIMVLFVIIIIIFMGVFIFYKYSIASLKETAGTLSEEEQTVLLASFPAMPEVGCAIDSCLDTAKFLPFKVLAKQKELTYAHIFGGATVWVEQVYPKPTVKIECNINHYRDTKYPSNCNHWVLYENKPESFTKEHKLSTIVSLYYPERDVYGIGRLHIEVYR